MASLSAYGGIGPWAARRAGHRRHHRAVVGHVSAARLSGRGAAQFGAHIPGPPSRYLGFAAIALALLHRERTGKGQYIDLSMQEANFTFIGDAWLEYELTGKVRGPLGNRHPQAPMPLAGAGRCTGGVAVGRRMPRRRMKCLLFSDPTAFT